MSSPPTPSDSSHTASYDWTSPEGLEHLKTLVQKHLPFEPRQFQLYDSACILNGRDVFCITATGDGKSALVYIPALARPDMITIVVEPTNALESDLAASLRQKGVTSVAINAETLKEAAEANPKRDLWREARECRYQVITTSPENLKGVEFHKLIEDKTFRARWRVLAADEAHLVDQWGADFRKAYADIWTLRSRGPEHLTILAMSASVEKGRQFDQIVRCLGFCEGTYHLDKRDCERRNVHLIFREARYAYTGHAFRDLDWLVPEKMSRPSDLKKWIIYCDTIEQGHRVTQYL
ncbi:P-loop containing nucleoside triphosphate hydrolase protein, partial [Auriscalpium vulgare]